MTTTPAADLDLIVAAAREAGALAQGLRQAGLAIDYKEGGSPVTNADLAADALLTRRLRDARPDYGWLSEETADDHKRLTTTRQFVVDPIDGTRAFLNRRPWWAVSIAVVEAGRPIAAAVFAPELDELHAATAGGGASLNGKAIAASLASDIEGCGMVADGRMFTHPAWPTPWPPMRIEQRNSTAYRICVVADGRFDAAVALSPKHDWDIAAADLIAQEAGAFCGDHLGRLFRYNQLDPVQASLVCAAPGLTPLILSRLTHIALGDA